jgi:hypothetical protein
VAIQKTDRKEGILGRTRRSRQSRCPLASQACADKMAHCHIAGSFAPDDLSSIPYKYCDLRLNESSNVLALNVFMQKL